MRGLFGGFSDAFWRRYETLYPIPDDVRDALPYYQVYYILVHVHFFGQGYCRHLRQVLSRYGL